MTQTSETWRALAGLIGLALGLLVLGCDGAGSPDPAVSSRESATTEQLPSPSTEPLAAPVAPSSAQGDEPSVAFPELARSAHSLADSAQSREEIQDAARKLESAYEKLPSGDSHLTREVGDDLAGRAARFYLKLGKADQAKAVAQKALDRSEQDTVGRANLLVVLADAEEALGDENAARDHLMSALATNQELLKKELENP